MAGAIETVAPADQESSVRLQQVRQAFLNLPEEQRAALHLVAVEGLSYQDAAGALGIPLGTLMSRIGRARALLPPWRTARPRSPSRRVAPTPNFALWEDPMVDPITEA